jgi:hypothetical protein
VFAAGVHGGGNAGSTCGVTPRSRSCRRCRSGGGAAPRNGGN